MTRLSILIFICLLTPVRAHAVLFSCLFSWRIMVTEKANELPFALAISDKVRFGKPGSMRDGTFLGTRVVSGETYLIFFDHSNESVQWIPERKAMFDGTKQPLQSIVGQGPYPTCLVHSTRNGLKQLNDLGLLPDSQLKTLLQNDPERLFAELKDIVSAEAWEKEYQKLKEGQNPTSLFQTSRDPNEWVKRFKEMGYTQADKRKKLFEQNGLKVDITASAQALREHLKKGMPAFLDVSQSYENQRLRQRGNPAGENLSPRVFYPVHHTDPRFNGWHSVLALGIVETGPMKGKVLVMDSAFGREVQLWDLDAVARTIDNGHSMAASLLSPAPK